MSWDRNEANQDREILDFRRDAAFSVYNWELFFHVPLYMAELLSQNQQFEDALTWFHYIFDPTRPGTDPAPKRFWIPKPLYNLTSAEILGRADQQSAGRGEPRRPDRHRRGRRAGARIRSIRSCSPTSGRSPT